MIALGAVALTGCDFDVSNPGPIHDEFVAGRSSHDALVLGAMRATLDGLGAFALVGEAVVRGYTPGGHTGVGGVPISVELGQLTDQWSWFEGADAWESAHQGRWIAQHAVDRITGEVGSEASSYAPLASAHLWAGFANRILGENACSAVFDGGPAEPHTNHFTRAITQFTQAAAVAAAAGDEDVRLAAIAGRAQVHALLGNWTEAAEDASQIPWDFAFEVQYLEGSSLLTSANASFKSLSFWQHPFEQYFPETGDPRAAWGHDPNNGADVPRPTWGRVIPRYYPLKTYAPRQSDELTVFRPNNQALEQIRWGMADGREMVLIRAEARLMEGNWQEAMVLINQVREGTDNYFTDEPLEAVSATSLEEAWSALKWERYVELNLEGRRLADRRRWRDNNIPGALHPLENLPGEVAQRYEVTWQPDLCFPIPVNQKERNENIPDDFVG